MRKEEEDDCEEPENEAQFVFGSVVKTQITYQKFAKNS